MAFRPLSTADVKTLSRVGLFDEFDINNEMLKLSLFDKLSIESKESCGVDADSITMIDFLSFLIGIRKLMNNELSFTFTCRSCEKKFDNTIDLEKEFNTYIFSYERKSLVFEKIDNQNNIWKFELENFTMKDYIYYRYYIDRLHDIDSNNPDVIKEDIYARPALYIKNIYLNNEQIEDWNERVISDKIQFLNKLPNEVVIDSSSIKNELDPMKCLSNFILENFDEEKMFKEVSKLKVTCPHCEEEYDNVFKLNDFFMF